MIEDGEARLTIIQLLVEKGADLKMTDGEGHTPEDLAKAAELTEACDLLRELAENK